MTKLKSINTDVINIYRSSCADTNSFMVDLQKIIDDKKTLIIGDFNLCFLSEKNHPIFSFLKNSGFHQLIKSPTHMKGGMIDLVFTNEEIIDENSKVSQQSPFFTDHDLIEIMTGKI